MSIHVHVLYSSGINVNYTIQYTVYNEQGGSELTDKTTVHSECEAQAASLRLVLMYVLAIGWQRFTTSISDLLGMQTSV